MFGFFCSDSCFQKVPAEWHESQPFLCLAGTPLWVCAFYQVFISGHLGRFHFVAIVNSAAVKVHIRFFVGTCSNCSWAITWEWNCCVIYFNLLKMHSDLNFSPMVDHGHVRMRAGVGRWTHPHPHPDPFLRFSDS